MSDSRDKYSVAPELGGENDPFAELSRIMGLEPLSEQPRQPETEDAGPYEHTSSHAPAEPEPAYPTRHVAQAGSEAEDHAVDSLELDLGSELDKAFSRDFGGEAEAVADVYEDYLSRDLSNDPYASNEPDPLDEWARSRTGAAQVASTAAAEQAPRPAATLRDPYSYSTQQVSRALVGGRAEPAAASEEPVEAQLESEPETVEEEKYDFSLEDELAALLAMTRDAEESRPAADEENQEPEGFTPFLAESSATASAVPSFRSTPVSAQTAQVEDFPEIETVEIDEAPRSAGEEFEVPELPPEEEAIAAPAFDDLAAELEGAFEAFDEPRVPKATEPVYSTAEHEQDPAGDFEDALYGEVNADSAEDASYDYSYRAADERYDDLAYEDVEARTEDLDDYADAYGDGGAVPPPARAHRDMRSSSRRRTMMVAAAVAAVALVGGVGAFALVATGSDDAEPALVLADVEPIKVRPENPGGTVVPNQESATYRRVSAGPAESVPQQQELITTAEEPVDVAARTAPGISPSGVEEDEVADLEPSAPALPGADADALSGTPKFDERIETIEELVASSDDQTVAVAPRRVRTMIVRPDGTIVPREEEAPQQAAAPVVQDAPSAPQQTQSALAPVQPALAPTNAPAADAAPGDAAEPQQLAQPEEESNIPDPVLPQSVSVAPTPRPGNGSVAGTAAPSPQPQAAAAPQQVAAAAPQQASLGAASSEWSMQIASQPSAESAQATYEDLARRYGNLLQGRGVNIVRAEIDGRGTYYRVRIPAASRDDAVSLCASYQAAGGSCFVSR